MSRAGGGEGVRQAKKNVAPITLGMTWHAASGQAIIHTRTPQPVTDVGLSSSCWS